MLVHVLDVGLPARELSYEAGEALPTHRLKTVISPGSQTLRGMAQCCLVCACSLGFLGAQLKAALLAHTSYKRLITRSGCALLPANALHTMMRKMLLKSFANNTGTSVI